MISRRDGDGDRRIIDTGVVRCFFEFWWKLGRKEGKQELLTRLFVGNDSVRPEMLACRKVAVGVPLTFL